MSRLVGALIACSIALAGSPSFAADAPPASPEAPDPALVARGEKLLAERACTACHTLDGGFKVGPTFMGLLGRSSRVVTAGKERTVTVDAAYIRRSIEAPDDDVVVGFLAGTMPALKPPADEIDAMVAALTARSGPDAVATAARTGGSMTPLWAAAILFVLLHLLMSSRLVRPHAVQRWGAERFQLGYSVVVAGIFGWMVWAWTQAPFVPLWTPAPWTRWVPLTLMPLSYILFVASLTVKSPTFAGMEKSLQDGVQLDGFLGITRHPMLWGFLLWGASHVPPNGELGTLIMAGSICALGALGMVHIELRRRAEYGQAWLDYAAKTSAIPFVAILRGRARITWKGLGWWRIAVGLAAYGSMLVLHELVIGPSALPQ